MTTEMWLIAAVRLIGALPVLRWPLAGALIAMTVDQSDLFMMNLIDLGGVDDYQTFDKYLDQAYLLTFLAVALRWQGPSRSIAVCLYLYRLAGFVAFEVTEERDILLFFPNFFEYWFLLIAVLRHFGQDPFSPAEDRSADGKVGQDELHRGQSPFGSPVMTRTESEEADEIERRPRLSSTSFAAIVLGLVAVKLFQEYALHYGRWLDGFTAVEAVEATWRFLTPPY